LNSTHSELHEVILTHVEALGARVGILGRVGGHLDRDLVRTETVAQLQLVIPPRRAGVYCVVRLRSHVEGHYSSVVTGLALKANLRLVSAARQRGSRHSVRLNR